jgi:hypothetical protein
MPYHPFSTLPLLESIPLNLMFSSLVLRTESMKKAVRVMSSKSPDYANVLLVKKARACRIYNKSVHVHSICGIELHLSVFIHLFGEDFTYTMLLFMTPAFPSFSTTAADLVAVNNPSGVFLMFRIS